MVGAGCFRGFPWWTVGFLGGALGGGAWVWGLSGFQGASRILLDLILAQGSPVRMGLGALGLVKAPCGHGTLCWDPDPTEGMYVYIISPFSL